MRFHVCALPHTQTTDEYLTCAYTAKVINFCKMMHEINGHEVFLYSGDQNEAPCTEHISCISEAERAAACGGGHYTKASFDYLLKHWKLFNHRAAARIRKRAQPHDFICIIAGLAQKQIADAIPKMMSVEFGIGYSGHFSAYRVFESYAWLHACYGAAHPHAPQNINGKFYDVVIPGYYDPTKFTLRTKPIADSDYFLFVGRLTQRKGIEIAEEACKHVGAKLLIAGPAYDYKPTYGEWIGEVGPQERNRLMGGAKALFVPTIYLEPFGNVNVEAQACGTPVISTDFGAMTETVEQGKTGFRCHTLADFIKAMKDVEQLDPLYIQQRALDLYSIQSVAEKYEAYFRRLQTLWGKGWYEVADAA